MRRGAALLLLALPALAAWTGCTKETPPTEMQVGRHRITVVVPEGWEHVTYGDRHQLRSGLARISIEAFRRRTGDLDAAVDLRLPLLGEDARRDEAARRRFTVGDHEAMTVDTWDKLSHQHRKRFAFVVVGDELVTFSMLQGDFALMAEPIDSLAASLVVVDTLAQAAVPNRVEHAPQ